jgi:hypothetical protein
VGEEVVWLGELGNQDLWRIFRRGIWELSWVKGWCRVARLCCSVLIG